MKSVAATFSIALVLLFSLNSFSQPNTCVDQPCEKEVPRLRIKREDNFIKTRPEASHPVQDRRVSPMTTQSSQRLGVTQQNWNEGYSQFATALTQITVSTIAGSNSGYADGPALQAKFGALTGVAIDAVGNVFLADYANHRIRKLSVDGIVSTLAGSGVQGYADGLAGQAQFNFPAGVAVDENGNVFVTDYGNNSIRKISPSGTVTTLAGHATPGYADAIGTDARFNSPIGIAIDPSGILYIGDAGNHTIRKITSDGSVSSFAGNGSAGFTDGVGAAATFNRPTGISIDDTGNIIVADRYNHAVRKISTASVVTTIAGNGLAGHADLQGINAQFNSPIGVAFDSQSSSIFVADGANNRIRKIDTEGNVSTYAGTGGAGKINGPAGNALFNYPYGIAVGNNGELLVLGYYEYVVRMISEVEIVNSVSFSILSPFPGSTVSTCETKLPVAALLINNGNTPIKSIDISYELGAASQSVHYENFNLAVGQAMNLIINDIPWANGENTITIQVDSVNSTFLESPISETLTFSIETTQGTPMVVEMDVTDGLPYQVNSRWDVIDSDGIFYAGQQSTPNDYTTTFCLPDKDYTIQLYQGADGEFELRTEEGYVFCNFTGYIEGYSADCNFSLPPLFTDVKLELISPIGTLSSCMFSAPVKVKVTNTGLATVSSFELLYGIPGTQKLHEVTGLQMSPESSIIVTLPNISLQEGDHNLFLGVASVNGRTGDDNADNNNVESILNFSIDPDSHQVSIELDVNYSPATVWYLADAGGNTLFSGINNFRDISIFESVPLSDQCLTTGCYHFTMFDPFLVGQTGLSITSNSEELVFIEGGKPWGVDLSLTSAMFCLGDVLQPAKNLRTTSRSHHSITIGWDYDGVPEEFLIYRSHTTSPYGDPIPYRGAEGSYDFIASVGANEREFVDENLSSNSTFYYVVVAKLNDNQADAVYLKTSTLNFEGFFEGFEDESFLSSGWSLIDSDGDDHNWELGAIDPTLAHEGMRSIYSYSWNNETLQPLTPDNFLVTPPIQINASDTLYYHVQSPDPSFVSETYSVLIGTGNEVENYTEIFNETISQADWTERKFSLSGYSNQTIRIAFRHHQSTDQFAIKLDNVLVGRKFYSIISPGQPEQPTEFAANGLSPHKVNLSWAYQVDPDFFELSISKGGSPGSYTFVERIAGDRRTFNLTDLDPSTRYFFQLRSVINEVRSLGTTAEARTTSADDFVFELFESFEGDVYPPEGWSVVDVDGVDGLSWLHATRELLYGLNLAFEGERFAASPTIYDGDPDNVDNWIITPPVTILNDYQLRYTIGIFDPQAVSYYGESYSILVNGVSSSLEDFVPILTEHLDPLESNRWVEREIDLSGYVGQTIRIAFRHNYARSTHHLSLDNIRVGNPNNSIPQRPSSPSNLVADLYSINQVQLGWNDNSNNEEGFQVQAGSDEVGPFTNIDLADPNTSGIVISGLASGQPYSFRIRAYNDYGTSSWSNISTIEELVTDAEQEIMQLVHVYPNPTTDRKFTIEFDPSLVNVGSPSHIEIRDVHGRLIFQYATNQSSINVDLSGFGKGLYVVNVYNGTDISSTRVVIN